MGRAGRRVKDGESGGPIPHRRTRAPRAPWRSTNRYPVPTATRRRSRARERERASARGWRAPASARCPVRGGRLAGGSACPTMQRVGRRGGTGASACQPVNDLGWQPQNSRLSVLRKVAGQRVGLVVVGGPGHDFVFDAAEFVVPIRLQFVNVEARIVVEGQFQRAGEAGEDAQLAQTRFVLAALLAAEFALF